MVGIHPDNLKSHASALKDTPAIYPFNRTDVKTFAVPKGQYNVNLDDIYQGKIPNRLVLGMLSADAYTGDLTKKHSILCTIILTLCAPVPMDNLYQQKLYSLSFPVTHI